MTNDAPERILARVDYDGTHDGTWLAVSEHEPPIEYTGMEPQYIRADLHTDALEAAERRGYARGIEAAAARIEPSNPRSDWTDYARDCHHLANMIRALSPTPPAPVTAKVKPLTWYDKPKGQRQRIGRSDQVAYSVCFDMGCWGYTRQGENGHIASRKGGRCFLDEADAISGAEEDHEARILSQIDLDPVTVQEAGFYSLILAAKAEAEKAMRKFPQPNYVISKVAEEAGEVVKAAIHCAEGREAPAEVRAEMVQLIAMLYRLWVEGDEVHGLRALAEQEGE